MVIIHIKMIGKKFDVQVCGMFPFVLMTSSQTIGGMPGPDFIATKDKMIAIFGSWEKKAADLVAADNDPFGNAATFLTPGNFDVLGSRIEAWRPAPLFVYIDEYASTILGFVLIQRQLIVDGPHKYAGILSAAVNPFHYGKGVGKRMIDVWIEHEKDLDADDSVKVDGVVLQSEPSAVSFWKKIGFTEWETTIESASPELTKMILAF